MKPVGTIVLRSRMTKSERRNFEAHSDACFYLSKFWEGVEAASGSPIKA